MSSIVRWNPVREIAAMQNLMDRLMDSMVTGDETVSAGRPLALDVTETKEAYTVKTALPGVDAENIRVNLEDDVLIIEAEMPERTTEREDHKVLIKEMSYGKFSRRVRLPQTVNSEEVVAEYNDGILTLTLPKSPEVQPRSIPVRRALPNHN